MHFDWSTLALQTANVLILIWLLRRFLFRPVVSIIDERRRAANALLAEAANVRSQAQADAEETSRQRQKLHTDGNHIITEARAAAEAARTELLQHAKNETAQLRSLELVKLEHEREQMRREAARLAVTIAERLLARIPQTSLDAALLQSLEAWLSALTPDEIRAISQPGEVLEIRTAASLDAQMAAACREMVQRYLGKMPLRFAIDPSLIAGIELRGPHVRVRNSWRSDLEQIAQELGRDDKRLAVA